jgi:ATP/ADP translocase
MNNYEKKLIEENITLLAMVKSDIYSSLRRARYQTGFTTTKEIASIIIDAVDREDAKKIAEDINELLK